MFKRFIFTLLLFSSGLMIPAMAQSLIKDIEVKVEWSENPQFEPGGVELYGVKFRERWLMVRVKYNVANLPLKGIKGRYKWLDEVSMKCEVMMASAYQGKKVPALMIGDVTYWSLEMNGKKKMGLMMVPPQVLRRYALPDMKFTRGSARKNLNVRVSFFNKEKRLIARGYFVPQGGTETSVKQMFRKNADSEIASVLRLKGTIFNRNEAPPWSVINYLSYPIIKKEKK